MTWLQTASGRAFDLLMPEPGMVDFAVDIPEALARIPRFTGHVRAGAYSVAQHCCLGADVILRNLKRPDAAAAFLLHDAHEAYVGDIATPIAQALAMMVDEGQEPLNGRKRLMSIPEVTHQIAALKMRVDRAIHAAAGCPWPLAAEPAAIVKRYDVMMLQAERRALMSATPKPWAMAIEAVAPASIGDIRVWPWPKAAEEYSKRLAKFFPHLAARAA